MALADMLVCQGCDSSCIIAVIAGVPTKLIQNVLCQGGNACHHAVWHQLAVSMIVLHCNLAVYCAV